MSGFASVIGGAISAGASLYANARNNEMNHLEREYAFERNLQAVREQNQYNDPASQVARLRSAGLNPNLAYGAQGATVGNQDATPEYDPASYSSPVAPTDPSGIIDSMVGIREQFNKNALAESEMLVNTDIRLLYRSNVRLNDANSKGVLELLDLKKENLRIQNKVGRISYDEAEARIKEIGQRVNNLIADEKLLKERLGLTRAEALNLDARTLISIAMFPYDVDLSKATSQERRAYASQAYENTAYISKYYELASRETSVKEGNLEYLWSSLVQNKDLTDKEREQVKELADKSREQGYWKIGADAFVDLLGIGVQVAMPTFSGLRSANLSRSTLNTTLSEFYGPGSGKPIVSLMSAMGE